MKTDHDEEDYDLNLSRFRNHKRVFPWLFIGKVVIGLFLIWLAYYFSKEMIEKASKSNPENTIQSPK